jgi:hypothetical protein
MYKVGSPEFSDMTSTLERGEMSAVLQIEVDLGPIGPNPSSLFIQMSSSNMAILGTGLCTLLSHRKGATLFRVNKFETFIITHLGSFRGSTMEAVA